MLVLLTAGYSAVAQGACGEVGLPMAEGFDSCGTGAAVMPPCWYVTRNYDSGYPPHVDGAQHSSGTAALVLYPGTFAGSHYSMAIAPPMAVDSLGGLHLHFRLMAASTAARLEVGICVDTLRQTRAFTPLDTLHVDQAMRWQDFDIDLGRYTGPGRRIAFRMQRALQADAAACWVDDVNVEACGVRDLRVEHIGSTTMTLVFSAYGVGDVQVAYADTLIDNAVSPLTLVGLQPLTQYSFTVGCQGGLMHTVAATTLEGAGLVPAYWQNFADGMPAGWRFPAGGTPSVANGRLRLTPTGGDSCVAVLPLQEAAPMTDLNVAMLLSGTGTTRVIVGVMDYADEPESFTPVDTLQCTAAERLNLVSLSGYAGQGSYIALMAKGSGTVSIGDVRVARCLLDNLRLYNLTESEATVAWDTLTLSAAVQMEYGPAGFTLGEGNHISPSSNPFTLVGLDPATTYDVYLWPACGDSISLRDKMQMTTFAHSVLPPYCTDFEDSGTMPQGWVGQGATLSANSYSGAAALRLAAGGRVSLPLLGSEAPDTMMLEFYATGSGTLSVGIATDAYSPAQVQATLAPGGWQHHSVMLAGVASNCITLEAAGVWTIDALTLHTATIVSTSVAAVGQRRATVRWQAIGSDSVVVEYSAVAAEGADFADGNGTTAVAADSIVFDNLVPGYHYTVHLRPLSDSAGCYPTVLHFRTLSDSLELPFCENFEGIATSGYPDTWRRRSAFGEYPIVSTERNNTGSRSLHFAASATQHTTAILPDADGCATHRTLAFWTNVTSNPQGAMLVVGTMTDIDDETTFTGSDTVLFSGTEQWRHHEFDLVPTGGHLAMRLVGGSGETHLFVDDLCLDACAARNVRLSSVQQNTATLSWTGTGVDAVVAHISGAVNRSDTFYTSPALIAGLDEDRVYYITVEALCECGGSGVVFRPGGASSGNVSSRRTTFVLNTLPSSSRLPICNTFESLATGNYPSGWRRRGSVAVSDRNYYRGGHSLAVDSGSYVILSQINQSSPVVLSFYAYSSEAALMADSALLIGITTNPDSVANMTVVAAMHLDALGEWQHMATLLGNTVASGSFIAIRCGADLFIDNITAASHGIGDAAVSEAGVVSWQQWYSTSVNVEYGPPGFTTGTGTDTTVASSPVVLSDIDPRLSYDIYLTPAGASNSCQSLLLTLGSSTSIPYCENLDLTPSGGMPQGWNIGRTYDGTPSINTTADGNNLYFKATASARSIAVLPKFAVDSLSDLQLTVDMKSSNSQRAMLLVGEVTSAADPNTFVPHDTLICSASNRWQTLHVPLTMFSGTGRIALACEATAQTAELWIDSIGITRGLTPTMTVVSARRVEVVSPAGAAPYIEYGPVGFEQGDGQIVHIDRSPYYIDGLTPDSSYWIYSRNDSNVMTCLSPLTVNLPTEVDLPYCHVRDTIEQLILPEFSIDTLSSAHLYFNLYGASRVAVGVMERRGDWSSFVAIDTVTSPASAHVPLDSYAGSGRFVAMIAVGGGNFVIDNLRVSPCALPVVSVELDGSVMVRGTGAVEYGGQRVDIVDSLLLSGLADTTTYTFYTLCDTLDVACGSPTVITTTMAVELPYCADLANAVPSGWTVVTGSAAVASGVLTLAAGTTLLLPVLPAGAAVMEYEERIGSQWQLVQTPIQGSVRPTITAPAKRTLRNISIAQCALPPELLVSQPGNGTISLGWDSLYNDFYIGYRLLGSDTMAVVYAAEQPLMLTVESDTTYELFLLCDTVAATCRPPLQVRTLATSVSIPYCQDIDNIYGVLPSGWRSLVRNGYTYLILPQPAIDSLRHLNITLSARSLTAAQATVVVGTMSDAANQETFDSLAAFTVGAAATRCFYSFADYYGAGRFLVLRVNTTDRVAVERIVVGECAAYNMAMVEQEADHVVFGWQSQGVPMVEVLYGPQSFDADSGMVATASESPFRIDGLSPLTNYAFYIGYSCPVQDSLCQPIAVVDTFFSFTPQGVSGCIDYTDLTASYASCNSGSYTNPSIVNGAIDHGYLSAASRHTVHFDTSERDPRTGGMLRTVPEGELSSVRLGNWLAGGSSDPQAESLTYALNVDSGDVDLLLLQYAAVLQDAEHDPSLQPRFRLEILNASGALIDSCGMVDFIANANLGWNQADDDVLWKDWTTVGLDLTPYAGQTIFIRLTTYDCGEGSHYGYAYFTLRCAAKRMETEGCSEVPSNRFTVPSGFNYSWTVNQSDSVISTERSILVPSDNDVTYFCHLSSIDNPACGFDMSAFAGARYPLALFDTALTVAGCQLSLQLTDRSTISFDGHNPVGTGEPCETIRWLLEDDTTTAAQQTLVFNDTTTIDVSLVAGIASDRCLDTITQRIHIAYPYPHAAIVGDTTRCFNDDPTAVTLLHTDSSSWVDTVMHFAPAADTIVGAVTVDGNGCIDTLSLALVVHPIYNIADSDSVCSSDLAFSWRDTALAFTIADSAMGATLSRTSQYGCDSIMTLALHLFPSYDLHHSDTVCDNHPLAFFDTTLAVSGSYLHADSTVHGCDSLVTMHLMVHPTHSVDDQRQVCDSLRWRDGVLYTADTAGAADSLLSSHGCDSVIVLSLNVYPSYHIADSDSVCSSALTFAWRDTALAFTIADDAVGATLSRTSQHGCDSIMTLALHLFTSYDIHHDDTVCDNHPLTFFDTVLATSGSCLHTDTTVRGCDSLVTMHLMVHPTFAHDDVREVCDSLRWVDGHLYLADTVGAIDTLPTMHACDSVLTLHLDVHPSYLAVERDTFCSGAVYTFRSHQLTAGGYYADTLYSIHTCDSILAIDLNERPLPQIAIRVEHVCDEKQYRLHAETDVPFVGWRWGIPTHGNPFLSTDTVIDANPARPTMYRLYAAYDDEPACMTSDSIVVSPFVSPMAVLRVSPQSLTPDNTHYDAYDAGQDYLYRRWYVDGERLPVDDRHIEGYADEGADTVWIALVVGTAYCDDTATASLAVRHHDIFVPNAFTPGAETNRTFFVVGKRIAHFEISIYNREGALVFETKDINEPWDGSNLVGHPCPTGNYVYRIRYSTVYQPQAYQSLTGTVLLIR